MADPPNSSAVISAAFPAPPPFYKSFTTSNLDRLSSIQESNPSITLLDLPPDIRNLLPPPLPPPNQQYRGFGEIHENAAPTSTDTPPKDPPNPKRLLKTTRQLLLTFLSLTNSLAVEPDTWAPKWDEMRALLSEAHGIVNEYRPHQARETLIHMMEEQIKRCKAETQGCRDVCDRVKKVIEDVESQEASRKPTAGLESVHPPTTRSGNKTIRVNATEKRIWEVIENEVGAFE
ncbi:MAG: hypothetical protein Q9209_007294 [Squamulea sp. 1 TL-2023]